MSSRLRQRAEGNYENNVSSVWDSWPVCTADSTGVNETMIPNLNMWQRNQDQPSRLPAGYTPLVMISGNNRGGTVTTYSPKFASLAKLYSDDRGNGVVGVWDRNVERVDVP